MVSFRAAWCAALILVALAACRGSNVSSTSASAVQSTKQATPGSADIGWTPPTTNTNGSTLTNLAGYDIYYGTSPTALTRKVQITNIGVSNYVISGLTSGTWYFGVSAYTTSGSVSNLSTIVSKTIS